MRKDDPQLTTPGAYRQLDPSNFVPAPLEGQGGVVRKKQPSEARRRKRPTVAARLGLDETDRKNALGEKLKNPHQLRQKKERQNRNLGPIGRAMTGITKRPKGRSRTTQGVLLTSVAKRSVKSSPLAKRREANRGKAPHSGGSPRGRLGGGPGGRNVPP